MFKKKASKTSSENETLICNNCASDILIIYNLNYRVYNVSYDFSADTYTCLHCNKIIMSSRIIEELDSVINPNHSSEED